MKELSIEEKAKRYDEALEKSKILYEQGTITESLCYVFPELKESEDDRIRKGLIKAFGSIGKKEWCGVNVKNAIAWLEKQKEFVSADFDDVWETADCDELTAPLEKYSKDAIKKMCHAWYDKGIELERRNWLEKQGEKSILFTFDDVLALQCCMETVKKVQEDKELYNELLLLHNKVHDAYTITKR